MKGLLYSEIASLYYYEKNYEKSIEYGEMGKKILLEILKIDKLVPSVKDLL